jgi:hypothetical protein
MSHGPDEVHEYVVEAGWLYPVSVGRLAERYPLANVEVDRHGNSMTLVELLERVEADRFDSRADLERAVGPVCAEVSASRRSGAFHRLRRLLG